MKLGALLGPANPADTGSLANLKGDAAHLAGPLPVKCAASPFS